MHSWSAVSLKWKRKTLKWAPNALIVLAVALAAAGLRAETAARTDKPDKIETMRLKILHASSTERRNEIRKFKSLTPEDQAKLFPVILKLCTDDMDQLVRETALRIFTEMKEKKAEPAFLAALKDKQEDVQLAGISGLREIESKKGGEPIYSLMKGLDPAKDVLRYTSAVRALGALEYKADIAGLIKTAEDSNTHEEIRRAIILYIGDVKAPEGREFLTKLAKNEEKEPDLRAYAANSLGRMKDSSAIPVLKEILENIRNLKNPRDRARMSRLRFQSMVALMRLGDRSMVPEIMAAAKDDDPVVRLRAVRQLGEMRIPETKELLEFKAKYDDNPRVKKAAQQALDDWSKTPGKASGENDLEPGEPAK